MPRRRKIDLLPAALRDWLKEELQARGFANYDAITEGLNTRLIERGLLLSIGRSAVAEFGVEHAEFARLQEEASGWAAQWMGDNGLEDEARRQSALFEMISTLAFKCIKAQFRKNDGDIDTRDLHLLGRMMKDLMASSGLREVISDKALERALKKERDAAAGRVETASRAAGLTPEVAAAIRAAVQGGADQ